METVNNGAVWRFVPAMIQGLQSIVRGLHYSPLVRAHVNIHAGMCACAIDVLLHGNLSRSKTAASLFCYCQPSPAPTLTLKTTTTA